MYENLMEEIVMEENLRQALKAVIRNQGAAGIDHMKTTEVEGHFQAHWPKIRAKLLMGPCEAGRNTQAKRGNPDAGNPDGSGSGDSADDVRSADEDLRSGVQ